MLVHFKGVFLAIKVQVNNNKKNQTPGILKGLGLQEGNERIQTHEFEEKKGFLKPDSISNAWILYYCFVSFQIYHSHNNRYITSTF